MTVDLLSGIHSGTRDLRGLMLVPLPGLSPPPPAVEILRTLQGLGVKDPILFGGALRDAWMGIPVSDYDIWGHLSTLLDPAAGDEANRRSLVAFLRATLLGDAPLLCEIRQVEYAGTGKISTQFMCDFTYRGVDISLFLDNTPLPLAGKLRGDAPLNTILMDAAGRIFAHPHFARHAELRLFEPYNHHDPREDVRRFEKLRAKIPGLKFSWGSWQLLHDFSAHTPRPPAPPAALGGTI